MENGKSNLGARGSLRLAIRKSERDIIIAMPSDTPKILAETPVRVPEAAAENKSSKTTRSVSPRIHRAIRGGKRKSTSSVDRERPTKAIKTLVTTDSVLLGASSELVETASPGSLDSSMPAQSSFGGQDCAPSMPSSLTRSNLFSESMIAAAEEVSTTKRIHVVRRDQPSELRMSAMVTLPVSFVQATLTKKRPVQGAEATRRSRASVTATEANPHSEPPQTQSKRKVRARAAEKLLLDDAGMLGEKELPQNEALRPPNDGLSNVDPFLQSISMRLTGRDELGLKSHADGTPEVWAERRQALCETLSYFKQQKGGSHANDGFVYGLLLDGHGHCRDLMNEDVIICRASGDMEADGDPARKGKVQVQGQNQSVNDAQPQSVQNNIDYKNPIAVICGNRNVLAHCKMPHRYCVLGWYKPVMLWAEKTIGKGGEVFSTIKYRLERLNRSKKPWHADPTGSSMLSDEERSKVPPLEKRSCPRCETTFPQVYLAGWMCLNETCSDHWKLNGKDASYRKMLYNPAFLLDEGEPWKEPSDAEEAEPSGLKPAIPEPRDQVGDNLRYIHTRGLCCPQCGMCSSRRLMNKWICENQKCGYEIKSEPVVIKPTQLHQPWEYSPTLVRDKHDRTVTLKVGYGFGYKILMYSFKGIDAKLIHFVAGEDVIKAPGGADEMLAAIQTSDIPFERRRFQGGQHGDGDLMNSHSMNYGMPYKFVAVGASQPFEGAPWPITEARSRLNWVQRTFSDTSNAGDFNELLVIAYLEKNKMEFHDDGEEGLGPNIATLSLGGSASMQLRSKAKHYSHKTTGEAALFPEERPVPGGMGGPDRDAAALEKWIELQNLRHVEKAAYKQRRKEIPEELQQIGTQPKSVTPPTLINMNLKHGDIVLMVGSDLQKYCEHRVIPEDNFRVAITAREIQAGHLKPEERPPYEVLSDPNVYDGSLSRSKPR